VNSIPFRAAGVVVPLSAIRGERGFGIGQFSDLGPMARALGAAGFSWLSLLPINEVAEGLTSPYSATSSHAFDPIYLDLDDIEEVVALGGERALSRDDRRALEIARQSPRVLFGEVRRIKTSLLRRAFIRFELGQGRRGASGARELDAFVEEMSPWLPLTALFHVLSESSPALSWRLWPIELRERRVDAVESAFRQNARLCRYAEWLQWHAVRQLRGAIDEVKRSGLFLAGDLPFALTEESAESWVHQSEINFDATLGTPPDLFFVKGQNWGLPAYDWEALARTGYGWFIERLAFAARFFDLVRLDHAAGYFRTWIHPKNGQRPHYVPTGESVQIAQGVEIIRRLREVDTALMAEDLGEVPLFVRQTLSSLGVPGMRVLRWEIDGPDRPHPRDWPSLSIAMTGTHDTPPISLWWESLDSVQRDQFCRLSELANACHSPRFDDAVWQGLLRLVLASGSRLALIPIEDVFGLREQINRPGTVSDDNWSFRLPWTVEELWRERVPREALERVAAMMKRAGRLRMEVGPRRESAWNERDGECPELRENRGASRDAESPEGEGTKSGAAEEMLPEDFSPNSF